MRIAADTIGVVSETGYFPILLQVADRRCVVVGGGRVGERKALALLAAGARVCVIAPQVTESLRERVASGAVRHIAQPFAPIFLDDAFVAVAATNLPDVNQAVADAARARGVLVNIAASTRSGKFDAGDFSTMAGVRRGDLTIALSTGGAGPALAACLRRELETQFPREWEQYVALLGAARETARAQVRDGDERADLLRRLAHDDTIRDLALRGDLAAARKKVDQCLSR